MTQFIKLTFLAALFLAAALPLSAMDDMSMGGGSSVRVRLFSGTTAELHQNLGQTKSDNGVSMDDTTVFLSGTDGEHLGGVAEINFEPDPEGGYGVDVERVLASYTLSDALQVRIGRDHIKLGYWNHAYHHGRIMQPSIDRPFLVRFEDEGGLIPNHLIGVFVGGKLAADQLEWELAGGHVAELKADYAGTTHIVDAELDPTVSEEADSQKAYTARLRWTPAALSGLGLGVSGVYHVIHALAVNMAPGAQPFPDMPQLILALDAQYFGTQAEFMTEFFHFNNEVSSGVGTSDNFGGFVHFGWHLNEMLTPYAQFTRASLNTSDVLWQAIDVQTRNIALVGLRWDIQPASCALKVEAAREVLNSSEAMEYSTNLSFGF